MTGEELRYAELADLLVGGPKGDLRLWAGTLILRTLETRGACRYRDGWERLSTHASAPAALASLRAAAAVLSPVERGLLLRTMLLVPWGLVRSDTGLSLNLPDLLAALSDVVGHTACRAAVRSVVEEGERAVSAYPLQGLLPEVRLAEEAFVFQVDPAMFGKSRGPTTRFTVDRLAASVQGFRAGRWESNLRSLVAWWLDALETQEASAMLATLLKGLRAPVKQLRQHALLLGLLDWMASHPEHPRAGEVLERGLVTPVGNVRRTAADLALVLGRRDVLENLAERDPDRGVRKQAQKLLEAGASGGSPVRRRSGDDE